MTMKQQREHLADVYRGRPVPAEVIAELKQLKHIRLVPQTLAGLWQKNVPRVPVLTLGGMLRLAKFA